jgi:cyclic nucleotide gated channel alpha 3
MSYMTFNYLVGLLVFAIVVGSVTDIIDDLNRKRSEFQQRLDLVKIYMQKANVNKSLQERVIKWFEHSWTNKTDLDEHKIIKKSLSENLQADIAISIHLETLKRVHIFKDCEPGLLQQLVTKLKLQVFSPGDYVCRKGDIGREMYFIKSGTLSVVSDDGTKIFANLTEGSYFGEISILDIPGNKTGNRRTANIRSVGFSDLFCLTKADLWKVLVEYPLAKKVLIETGKSLLRKDNLLNEQVANEIEEIERLNSNLDDKISEIKIKLSNLDRRSVQLSELIMSGMNMIQVRIENIDAKIMNF